MKFRILISVVLLAAVCSAGQVSGLGPSSVIGGSASYGTSAPQPWNGGSFPTGRVLDQQTGAVGDGSYTNYWLGANGDSAAYFVIDLGAVYHITSFDIFNTHNNIWGDRGTGGFTITAGNTVTDTGGGNFNLSGTTEQILGGTLTAAPTSDPITAQHFGVSDPGNYRYVRFNVTSLAAACTNSSSPCPPAPLGAGLSELRVSGDTPTPEPTSAAVVACALIWLSAARRRHVKA
jgi:hypothetical protein